ncbi:MAG TPA: hypothetical protein VLJ41_05335, partial [Segetibacter sp.]|nr:hypothetical protein [Segetibacter sp.]
KLPLYYTHWAEKQFGATYAKEIGEIVALYSKYNSRRKPELLSPDTYSLTNYNEAARIVKEYNELLDRAQKINQSISSEYKDAFYELVLHPVEASANLNELYVTVAKNRQLAKQGNITANAFADKAKALYVKDSLISNYYNDTLANGKWRHMMDQTHIGYTYWQQPLVNKMPEVMYVNGNTAMKVTSASAETSSENVQTKPLARYNSTANAGNSFIEKEGYVSIEAANYSKAVTTPQIKWHVIPNLGRTYSAVEAMPVTAPSQTLSANSPHLEYTIIVPDTALAEVHVYLSPTLQFHNEGLRYGISIDDEKPQIVNMHEGYTEGLWNKWVADNIIEKVTQIAINKPGKHVLKFWMVDPAVVLQKIVIDLGGLKPSYLGPQETKIK